MSTNSWGVFYLWNHHVGMLKRIRTGSCLDPTKNEFLGGVGVCVGLWQRVKIEDRTPLQTVQGNIETLEKC